MKKFIYNEILVILNTEQLQYELLYEDLYIKTIEKQLNSNLPLNTVFNNKFLFHIDFKFSEKIKKYVKLLTFFDDEIERISQKFDSNQPIYMIKKNEVILKFFNKFIKKNEYLSFIANKYNYTYLNNFYIIVYVYSRLIANNIIDSEFLEIIHYYYRLFDKMLAEWQPDHFYNKVNNVYKFIYNKLIESVKLDLKLTTNEISQNLNDIIESKDISNIDLKLFFNKKVNDVLQIINVSNDTTNHRIIPFTIRTFIYIQILYYFERYLLYDQLTVDILNYLN